MKLELLTTNEAAELLRRAPQTLRKWACIGGPIEPIRIGGKGGPLNWRRTDVERLIGISLEAKSIGGDAA
jgi:hypothetical protein